MKEVEIHKEFQKEVEKIIRRLEEKYGRKIQIISCPCGYGERLVIE